MPAQILTIDVQEIEGKEHEPVRRRVDRRSKGIEVGKAVLVLDNHLAMPDCPAILPTALLREFREKVSAGTRPYPVRN